MKPNWVRSSIGRLCPARRAAPVAERVVVMQVSCATGRRLKREAASGPGGVDQSTLSVISPYGPFHQRTHTRDVFRLPKNDTMTESVP
jgi:hypothetical protein